MISQDIMDSIRASFTTVAAIVGAIITIFGFSAVIVRYLHEWSSKRAEARAEMERLRPSHSGVVIRQVASTQELNAVCDFDLNSYGPANQITQAKLYSWWSAYPDGLWAAFERGQPVGVFGIFPVTEKWAQELIGGNVQETELSEDTIRSSDRRFWYLSGISLKDPQHGLSKILARLLCHGIHRWSSHEFETDENRLITVLAVGSTPQGRHLLQRFNFEIAAPAGSIEHPIFRRRLDYKRIAVFLREGKFCSACRKDYTEI